MRRTIPGVIALLALSVGGVAHADTDPGTAEWQQVPRDRMVAECGMDPAMLDAAAPRLAQTPFVVIRHGKLCWEGGWAGGSTQPYSVFSVTKTFGALLVGMVDGRTQLSDTDVVTKWIPPAELGAINPQARIAHVLAMVSTNAKLGYREKGAWSYDTAGDREINRLVGVMDRAIAGEREKFPTSDNVKDFAQRELFDPLGMRASSWPGQQIGGNLQTSVRDMARLGQLMLQRGRWNGRQLLDEDFVYKMTHPAFEDANTGYNYLTYSNAAANFSYPTSTNDTTCTPYSQWPSYPHRPFFESPDSNGGVPDERPQKHDIGVAFASGTGGQKFTIYRGLDMVIAIRDSAVGVNESGRPVDQFPGHKSVWNALRPAMLKYDPVYKNDEAGFCAAYRRSEYAPTLREPWFKESQAQTAPGEQPVGRLVDPSSPPPPACVSRRRLTIGIPRPRGMRVRRVTVTVDGRAVTVRRGKRMRAVVDLRGRSAGTTVVRIRIDGRRRGKAAMSRQTRAFRTCTGKGTPG